MTKPKRLVVLRGKRFHREFAYGTTYKFKSQAGLPALVPFADSVLTKIGFLIENVVRATKRNKLKLKLVNVKFRLITHHLPYGIESAYAKDDEDEEQEYETWVSTGFQAADTKAVLAAVEKTLMRIEFLVENIVGGYGLVTNMQVDAATLIKKKISI